jgi:hypothetical protein
MSDTLVLGTVGPDAEQPDDVFDVPREVAKYSQALLAVTGSGKSNAAVVMAEEQYAAGVPWVALDPKGDWHGIRYSAIEGEPGLPIPVFGGQFGNAILTPAMGARMAELVVELNLTCVLDLSEFDTKGDVLQFVHDFVRTLFRLHGRNRTVRHVFLEECDEYMPQKPMGASDAGKNLAIWCLAVCQKLVKQGRQRGLGCTMISQRPAVVNKDALTQILTLYVLGMTSPQDRKAIREWVDYHADAKEIVDSLPMLEPGEAWVVSPRVLKRIDRIWFRQRWTLDTGSTPDFDEFAATVGTMATIDMSAIEQSLAEVIEQAKENDPIELKKQLAERDGELAWWQQFLTKVVPLSEMPRPRSPLVGRQYLVAAREAGAAGDERWDALIRLLGDEPLVVVSDAEWRELQEALATPVPTPVLTEVPTPVLEDDQIDRVSEWFAVGERIGGELDTWKVEARSLLSEVTDVLSRIEEVRADALDRMEKAVALPETPRPAPASARPVSGNRDPGAGSREPGAKTPGSRRATAQDIAAIAETVRLADVRIGKQERSILAAALEKPDADRRTLAWLCGTHERTKTWTNALGGLRTAGLMEDCKLTDAGRAVCDELGIEIFNVWEHWYQHPKVGGVGRQVLDLLLVRPYDREELAEALGYMERTKTFTNKIGELRNLGLVSKSWPLRLSELMEEWAP